MRKYLVILACSLLLAPVLALLIAKGIYPRSLQDPRAIADQALLYRFRSLAEGTLVAAVVLPALYVGSMLALRRRRRALARSFKLIIRCGLTALALLLLAEGALLVISAFLFVGVFDIPEQAGFVVPGLISLIAAVGLGMIGAAVSTVAQWSRD